MKKYLVILLLLISAAAKAQVGLGLEAGANSSYLKIIPPGLGGETATMIQGVTIGGIADIPMSPHFYFQTGLYFSMKGSKDAFRYDDDSVSVHTDETRRLNYLQLPLTVLFKTGYQGKGRFFFGGGAVIGIAMGGKETYHTTGFQYINRVRQNTDTAGSYPIKAGTDTRSIDAAINMTLGYEWNVGWFIRGAYAIGITNISTDQSGSEKNRAATLSIGYYFGDERHTKVKPEQLVLPD